MMKTFTASLVNGCRVTQMLIERYGQDLNTVQQTDKDVFRAQLKGGDFVEAAVLSDGSLRVRELEAVC